MGRLTHKVDGKYYPSMNNLVQEKDYQSSNYRGLIHEKLGRIEDLMENYGIESVEELELIIKDHKRLYNKEIELSADLGMYQNENERLTKDIEKYWELEQQLGINLEDLFKEIIGIKNNLGEVDSDINPDYLAYVVSNGITYGKLSKELGCDLDVVFKALISGIIVRNDEDLIEIGYSDREDKYVYFSTEEIYLKNWQSHGIEKTTNCFQINYGDDGEWCVYLEDYQKTWWLASDKKEKPNDN